MLVVRSKRANLHLVGEATQDPRLPYLSKLLLIALLVVNCFRHAVGAHLLEHDFVQVNAIEMPVVVILDLLVSAFHTAHLLQVTPQVFLAKFFVNHRFLGFGVYHAQLLLDSPPELGVKETVEVFFVGSGTLSLFLF